jgi:hypothetical protein
MEIRLKRIALAVSLLSLCGCAARVFEVRLAPPEVVAPVADVTVQDARLDPQIYMTGISMGSTSSVYLLAPDPSLDFMLQSLIQAKLPNFPGGLAVTVRIERLDLKNKVGFAKADELYCEIESSVVREGTDSRALVRTFSKNVENMSPRVATSARVILQQCVEQHAQEIAQQLTGATTDG